jgi:hypothetical protein
MVMEKGGGDAGSGPNEQGAARVFPDENRQGTLAAPGTLPQNRRFVEGFTVEIKKLGQDDLQRLMRRSAAALALSPGATWDHGAPQRFDDVGADDVARLAPAPAQSASDLRRVRAWLSRRWGAS